MEGHPQRRRILAVLCLSLLIVVIDNTILNTALPSLARALSATTSDLQWITDAYTLTFAALLIVAGALGDRYGRRGALLAGLVLFGAGSTAAGLSDSAGALIAFRAVMGAGAALVMPATLSVLTTVFPERERAQAIAAWSAVAGAAIVIGPTLGGLLLERFDWSAVFFVNVPLVALALALVVRVVPRMPGHRAEGRLDLAGAGLSALAMLAIIDAVIEAPDQGWLSARTLGVAGAGFAALAGFVVHELRAEHPLIDVRVFRHRAFSAATSAVGLTFFSLFGSLFVLTQYLQFVHGYSPLGAGLRALPFGVGVMIAAPSSSLLVRRLGIRRVVPAGLLTMGIGMFTMTSATPHTGLLHLSVSALVMGLGMGLVLAPAGESLMSVLPSDQGGVGAAVNDTVQELGGSLGVAVIGSVVSAVFRDGFGAAGSIATAHGLPGADAAFMDAFTTGFGIAAAVAAAGALVLFFALPAGKPAALKRLEPVWQ